MPLSTSPAEANFGAEPTPPVPARPISPVSAPVSPPAGTGLPLRPIRDVLSVSPPPEEDRLPARAGYLEDQIETPLSAPPVNTPSPISSNSGLGSQATALTAQDLIENDYDTHYGRLQDKVASVKIWLQDVLTERNKTGDIAKARSERGVKYEEMKVLIDQLLTRYFAQEQVIRRQDIPVVTAMVTNEMLGLGPIEPLWLDPRISEIMVNGPFRIRVEIKGKLVDVPGARFRDQEHLLEVCQQMLAPLGRTLDISNPYEDGRLPDGSRINATHPIIGPQGPFLTIRRFPETIFSLKELVRRNSMTEEMAVEIGNLVYSACSILVVGSTGSGKTSLLNALSGCIPTSERIITIEDNLELQLHPSRDVAALESKKSHQGERGSVTIRDLVKNTLRMRPDRIIVGEVRDGSAYDMLQAMNTGHDGSMTTVHANDANGGIDRIVNLMAEVGDIDTPRALSLVAGGIDIIVVVDRFLDDGSRRVAAIAEVPPRVHSENGVVSLDPIILYEFNQTGLGKDENGEDTVIGEYVKVNDLSPALIRKHRLDKRKKLTLEQLYEISENAKDVTP
jgi:pilus assembly protein CpaF